MSIPDIKALLSTDDADARVEIITTHLEQMEVQLQQTLDTVGALRELLAPLVGPRPRAGASSRRSPSGPSAPPSTFLRSTTGLGVAEDFA